MWSILSPPPSTPFLFHLPIVLKAICSIQTTRKLTVEKRCDSMICHGNCQLNWGNDTNLNLRDEIRNSGIDSLIIVQKKKDRCSSSRFIATKCRHVHLNLYLDCHVNLTRKRHFSPAIIVIDILRIQYTYLSFCSFHFASCYCDRLHMKLHLTRQMQNRRTDKTIQLSRFIFDCHPTTFHSSHRLKGGGGAGKGRKRNIEKR